MSDLSSYEPMKKCIKFAKEPEEEENEEPETISCTIESPDGKIMHLE